MKNIPPFTNPLQVIIPPPTQLMRDFVDRHRHWVESTVGCSVDQTVIFDFHLPFPHLVMTEMFDGAPLDRRSVSYTSALRRAVTRWQIPPGMAINLDLSMSRNRDGGVAQGRFGWAPDWIDTPLAVWLSGCRFGIVHAPVFYTSIGDSSRVRSRSALVVNRAELQSVLRVLESIEPPKLIRMMTGPDIPLSEDGYDWNSLVLNAELEQTIRRDFELFFEREEWFRRHGLPFRRGYLFFGPPGNGKTSAARVMACRPGLRAFGIDFRTSRESGYEPDQVARLFDAAATQAPSLVILEDIDKIGGGDPDVMQSAVNTLLSCMDGLATEDGVIVVATANDPRPLTRALVRRPGRFDRTARFALPDADLRALCLSRLSGGRLTPAHAAVAAGEMDRFSFAQVREAYIVAGQLAFDLGDGITADDLIAAADQLKRDSRRVGRAADSEMVGFTAE